MNFASAGVGSVAHLNFEVFKDAVGMEAIHIPYKGAAKASRMSWPGTSR